jgi:hypothetical protein
MLLNTLGKVNREDLLSYHKDLVRRVNETNEKYHVFNFLNIIVGVLTVDEREPL